MRTGRLIRAFEEDFWRAEAPCAGAVGTPRGTRVVLGVARCGRLGERAVCLDLGAARGRTGAADAREAVGAFALGEAEVHEDASPAVDVVEEVCGLDVSVEDAMLVHGCQRREE